MDGANSHKSGRGEAVRVLTIKANTEHVVRFLGGIDGLLTHRVRNKPRACPGVQLCPPGDHRSLTLWKGYAPVLQWVESRLTWLSAALEVTEGLGLVLAERTLRGEEWLISRPQETDKPGALLGAFLEAHDADRWPDAFDVHDTVQHYYGNRSIAWGIVNPARPRLMLAPVGMPGPCERERAAAVAAAAAEEEASAADRERVAKLRLGDHWKAIAPPSPNGKH